MSTLRSLCVPLLALSLIACGSDPPLPSPSPVVPSLEVYTGPLNPGGSQEFLFSLDGASTVQVMLAGVVTSNPLQSLSPTLRLELATWNGSGCDTRSAIDVAPRFKARLQLYLNPGAYCARVSDIGELTQPVAVAVRVVAPALLSVDGEPGSRTFSSTITSRGSASTTFVASRPGRVTISLDSVSETVEMALALGLPDGDGRGCNYGEIVRTTAGGGPHIDAEVDAGYYCAAVIDVGNLTAPATFSLTATHP